MSVTVEFVGRVDSYDTPDNKHHGLTTRIGARDVLETLDEAAGAMLSPITAAVTIGTESPITGELDLELGLAVGCETCYEASRFMVGDVNVMSLLDALDDQDVQVTVTLAGRVPAAPQIVAVEVAHPLRLTKDGPRFGPGAIIEVPRAQAQDLTRDGGITRESAIAAGLTVAPLPPEFVR